MSIGKRLVILVAVTMLGLAGTGLYGVWKLNDSRASFDVVTDRSVPAIVDMGQVSDSFKETRALLLALLMEEDADLRTAFGQKIDEANARLAKGIESLGHVSGFGEVAASLGPMAHSYIQAVKGTVAKATNKDAAQLDLYTKVIPAEKALGEALTKQQSELLNRQKGIRDQVQADGSRAVTVYAVVIATGFLIVGVLGVLLYRSVMAPLSSMTDTMASVAESLDFTSRVPVNSNDELGTAVVAFNRLLETVQSSLREIATSMGTLAEATTQLRATSGDIEHISTETSKSSSSVAQAVQDVTASITGIASRTEEAENLARDAGMQAGSGGEIIKTTIGQIRGISDTVHSAASDISSLREQIASITSVLNVIREVADQTNLLALNAAIEAARAGEQGRGFAVVADEVRKLAERTAQSTHQISELITNIQQSATAAVGTMNNVVERVEIGVENAGGAIGALDSIRASTENVLATVSNIADAIRAQRDAATHISLEFEAIARISSEASQATAATNRNTQDLERLASQVHETVQRYRI